MIFLYQVIEICYNYFKVSCLYLYIRTYERQFFILQLIIANVNLYQCVANNTVILMYIRLSSSPCVIFDFFRSLLFRRNCVIYFRTYLILVRGYNRRVLNSFCAILSFDQLLIGERKITSIAILLLYTYISLRATIKIFFMCALYKYYILQPTVQDEYSLCLQNKQTEVFIVVYIQRAIQSND